MRDLLKVAYENIFAGGSFNVGNSEFVKVVITAAVAQNSPAIM
ncbi:class II fructose-bisphosphate aldolase, partial [Paenibacillus sp. PsM32]